MNLNNFFFAVDWAATTFTWIGINKIFLSSILNALNQKITPSERFFIFSDDIIESGKIVRPTTDFTYLLGIPKCLFFFCRA